MTALATVAIEALPELDRRATVPQVVRAVRDHGGVVVCGLADVELMRKLDDELRPYLAIAPHSEGSFTGVKTRRVSRLVARSPASRELMMHPLVVGALSELFRDECYNFQIANTTAIQIDPGQPAQSLHRDDNLFPFRHPCPPYVIAAIWAVDAFTLDNGATRVVAGSHIWGDHQKPLEHEARPVVMPRGSVLLYDGALFHGGGENRTDASRLACLFGYALGWLRQLENQFLAVPPDLARTLPRALQRLLGYSTHGFLGSFEDQDPIVALNEHVPEVLPSHDLYTAELQSRPLRRR